MIWKYNTRNDSSPNDPTFAPSKTLNILMAKTVALQDVDMVIDDIQKMSCKRLNNTHLIQIKWILFCFEHQTKKTLHDKLQSSDFQLSTVDANKCDDCSNINTKNVRIIFEANKLKHYFWQTYLTPNKLDSYFSDCLLDSYEKQIDYIWIADGDIIISSMNWNCFWYYIDSVYKPFIFQPSIINPNNYYPTMDEKHFHTTLYPLMCNNRSKEYNNNHDTKTSNTRNYNYNNIDIESIFGIETSFVEIQTPIFRYQAWIHFIEIFNQRFGKVENMNSRTDWGPDYIWCNMINRDILNQSPTDVYNNEKQQSWDDVKNTCQVKKELNVQINISQSSNEIACMIVHGTPVKHYDTKTHPVHDTNGLTQKQGPKQAKLFETQLFPEYYKAGDQSYYRVFAKDETFRCDSCHQWYC